MSGVNDFAFKMGTVNGTGSASANSLLMQAIFRMGIPVTGKNLFPSNIQGLPTWYEIRVSKDGYTARPEAVDLMVALNTTTYAKDVAAVRPGGYLLYDSSWPLDPSLVREGITILGVPFGKMCVEHFQRDRDRTLLRNIVYARRFSRSTWTSSSRCSSRSSRKRNRSSMPTASPSGSATTTRRNTSPARYRSTAPRWTRPRTR
jgi:Pyruvate/2-oxoacid:ferredoxin oxidoreductase gamma subunit